jgi:hypothetical protein
MGWSLKKVEQIKTKNKNQILHKSYVGDRIFLCAKFCQNIKFFSFKFTKLIAFVGILVVKF